MSNAPQDSVALAKAIDEAAALVPAQPQRAAEQLARILAASPGETRALLLLGMARRNLRAFVPAVEILAPLASKHPEWAEAHYELGVTLMAARRPGDALGRLLHAAHLRPDIGEVWLLIADALLELGDPAGADQAYANHMVVPTGNPALLPATAALCEGRLDEAEALLAEHLERQPDDVTAMGLQAEVLTRGERHAEAEALFARCVALAPDDATARRSYPVALYKQGKMVECLAQVDRLLATHPRDPSFLTLKANALTGIGEFDQAAAIFSAVLKDYPSNAKIWLTYGHSLRTAGKLEAGIDAYRSAIRLAPSLGEAYWSLANLKTFRFSAGELEAMRLQLARTDLSGEDRVHFHFALGKALEDSAAYAGAFEQYAEGNRIWRARNRYDAAELTAFVARNEALFTREFLLERRDRGCQSASPIFIVGLPRAGSTLLEQILASHPAVEGTMELFDVHQIVRSVAPDLSTYPGALARLGADELRGLGEQYLQKTRVQRKSAALHFIDKMPNNWAYVGLIHLMLPNARIIDARRHPMGCCFSCFKQHFPSGQHFSNDLEDLGRYYADYVRLMAHFDAVLPGRVHRVLYEQLVGDTEGEVRRLLAYCGLPFAEACLRFHENPRAVNTPSAEQVRQPIFQEGMSQWRHFESWLGPLRTALGPALEIPAR